MYNKEQRIECDVTTCKHIDCGNNVCKLEKIKVSCNCENANSKDDTICSNYKEK